MFSLFLRSIGLAPVFVIRRGRRGIRGRGSFSAPLLRALKLTHGNVLLGLQFSTIGDFDIKTRTV